MSQMNNEQRLAQAVKINERARSVLAEITQLRERLDAQTEALAKVVAERNQLRLSNERLREALKQINLFVSGDARPKWSEDRDVSGVTATTRSRMNIGDICGLALTAESGTEGKG